MAVMKFRESNQVKWLGVRPAHNGLQVIKSLENVTNSTSILHTVTTGKTFFLSHWSFSAYATAAGNAKLEFRNDVDITQYLIEKVDFNAAFYAWTSSSPKCPLEIPADWDIVVVSANAFTFANAFIHGWEE